MKRTIHIAASLKRLFIFIASVVIIVLVYRFLLPNELRTRSIIVSIILLWAFSAYIVLPRIHRLLSRMYVPDYFIGRTRTVDGLLGDPVNLALVSSEKNIRRAMQKAGWVEATPITLRSTWKLFWKTLQGKDYPDAPMSDLILFDRSQDLAFQMQVEGNPRKRHHVRFWRTEQEWYLPGGHAASWVGAATYDSAVGLSMFTLQLTHRIDPNIDEERDYLVTTLGRTGRVKKKLNIEHFFPPFITRNGGGDRVRTDGSMVILTLK